MSLYERDIPHLPLPISRREFVHKVFDIGCTYNHTLDTILTAIDIADNFISHTGETPICNWYNTSYDFMLVPIDKIYSLELAYVTSTITAKIFEDYGLVNINYTIDENRNNYIRKMEWEILMLTNFHITRNTFSHFLNFLLEPSDHTILNDFFYIWCEDICSIPQLQRCDPRAILIGSILLYRRNKLKSQHANRSRIFLLLMTRIANEAETSLYNAIRAYSTSRY